eukprot:980159_1
MRDIYLIHLKCNCSCAEDKGFSHIRKVSITASGYLVIVGACNTHTMALDTLASVLIMMVIVLLILLFILTVMLIKMSSDIASLKRHDVPSLHAPSVSTNPPLRSGYSVITDWSRGELIGRGGFGNVFLAIDRNSGALFATKQVPLLRDINGKRTFQDKVDALRKEIKTLSQLSHVNIVQYLGTSRSNRNLYVHLEFVEGGSLAQLIHEFGALSLSLIQHYAQQILKGLQFLHQKGLVHRDIKPNNILVSKDGCCKLADFGCVKHLEELGERSSYTGTAIYMSPESHRQRDVCYKSDIWSFGCTIIECANGIGPIWLNFTRYKLFVYISGTKFDPKIPQCLADDGVDFVRLCMMQKPESRADATTLLKHPFIVNKQGETRRTSAFGRATSDSSIYGGLPNITRYVSDESDTEKPVVVPDKVDTNAHVNLRKIYAKSMQLATGNIENEPRKISPNSLSRSSSDLYGVDHQAKLQLKSIQDVQNAVQRRSQAIKQKHLKWLVTEKSRPRTRSGGCIEHHSKSSYTLPQNPDTICITKGIARSRENIQVILQAMENNNKAKSNGDCDFESI